MDKGKKGSASFNVFPVYFIVEETSSPSLPWCDVIDKKIRELKRDLKAQIPLRSEDVAFGTIYIENKKIRHKELLKITSPYKREEHIIHEKRGIIEILKNIYSILDNLYKDKNTTPWPPLILIWLYNEPSPEFEHELERLRNHPLGPYIISIGGQLVDGQTLERIAALGLGLPINKINESAIAQVIDRVRKIILKACNNQGRIDLSSVNSYPSQPAQVSTQPPRVSTNQSRPAETRPVSDARTQRGSSSKQQANVVASNQAMEPARSEIKPAPEPAPPPKAVWLEKEPDDITDQFDHFYTDKAEKNGWRIFGASRRGKSHAHDGKYREDAIRLKIVDGWNVIAVADGAGSCKLSRVGSNKAVDTAIEIISDSLVSPEASNQSPQDCARMTLQNAFEGAYKSLEQEAMSRNIPLKELSTTLGLLLHRPGETEHLVATVQVGDPLLAGLFDSNIPEVLADEDGGEYAGESVFLTSKEVVSQFSSRFRIKMSNSVKMLLLMTDGVSNDFFPYNQYLHVLFEYMAGIANINDCHKNLLEWLAYDKRGSFDDRSLVVVTKLGETDHGSNVG